MAAVMYIAQAVMDAQRILGKFDSCNHFLMSIRWEDDVAI